MSTEALSAEGSARRVARSDESGIGTFSCVVDEHPRFHLDALRWFAALTEIAGVEPEDLTVHAVGDGSSDVLEYLKHRGVSLRPVERFDPRSPHCNKISGALQLATEEHTGMAVLCDSDLVLLEDPRLLPLSPGRTRGKLVDAPVPPLPVLLRTFEEARVDAPTAVVLPWGTDEWTVSGYCNGGLYLVPAPLLSTVASAWARWARWLLDRMELLGEWSVYVDQVAMALALAAEGIGSDPLDRRWNTPIHDPARIPSDGLSPAGIHYHQEVDRRGLIRLTGLAAIDERIGNVNRAIEEVWQQARAEATYQRWLEASPEASEIQTVRTILSTVIDVLPPASILEVGWLDSGIIEGLELKEHIGLDQSSDGAHPTAGGDPTGGHVAGHLSEVLPEADVTVCLNELMTLAPWSDDSQLVEDLWRSTKTALVLRVPRESVGQDPHSRGSATAWNGLDDTAPEAELYPLHDRDGSLIVMALRPPANPHPRDFGAASLAPLIDRHPDPLGLAAIRLHARRTTGFYPDHAPRLWEYPVVSGLVVQHLPPGSRVVDVGAGVTPLAPFLTHRGYVVETVDPSTTIRTWPSAPDWNEWGFLDYGAVGLAHRSWNRTLGQLPKRPPFDGAYSVSVIEHLPAVVRRSLLGDMATRVRPGGLLLLTIDLLRGEDLLWNRNLGEEVEPFSRHGTLDDVVAECDDVGFDLLDREVVRDWGDTRVDIGLLVMGKRATGSSDRHQGMARGLRTFLRRGSPRGASHH